MELWTNDWTSPGNPGYWSAEVSVPPLVAAAAARARQAGFPMSCDLAVGRLLAVLAAHLPKDARVLELGTGTGVGAGWIVSGLLPRTDVAVVSVEKDPGTAEVAARGDWPSFVQLRCGDALEVLADSGTFDLIFADAPGGKWEGLDRSVAALRPHGLLIVDDMTPELGWTDSHQALQDKVRQALLSAPELTSAELAVGSGVILSVRGGWGAGAWAAGARRSAGPVRRRCCGSARRPGRDQAVRGAPGRTGRSRRARRWC
jgi:predicted O-methyltransferase YrrM